MAKISKILMSSLLTVSMFVATVICCCIGSGVMAHFHKPAMCCEKQNPSHQDSPPMGSCQSHLTSAELGIKIFFELNLSFFNIFQGGVVFVSKRINKTNMGDFLA